MSDVCINVDLGDRSYPIYIGSGGLSDSGQFDSIVAGREVLVVTNKSIEPLYLKVLTDALRAGSELSKLQTLVLPDGEQFKNLDTLNLIFDCLLEHRFSRSAVLIALGGGVIGDMVGFSAACYQRGIEFVQVPTTLLSQVDSSVGGKTGVNHALGKNMVGAFHQPQKVVIDIDVLQTLPEREISAGIAEVIKYGFIYDSNFFQWLEVNIERLMQRDEEALIYAIKRSCEIKAEVVAKDEKESGLRAILNFGHTYGHAIENHQGYGEWLHGEAVGAGMIMACDLSRRLGWLTQRECERAETLLEHSGLPLTPPGDMTAEDFLSIMSVDKKVDKGKLRLVLLKGIGQAVVTDKFGSELLKGQLQELTR